MKHFALGLGLLFLYSGQIFASEWISTLKDGSKQYLVEYQDQGFHVIEVFQQPAGGIQDRVARFSYVSESEKNKKLEYLFNTSAWSLIDDQKRSRMDLMMESPTEVRDLYIWKAENEWSENWEQIYSGWVRQEITPDYFARYNVKTDCADVAFLLRWIFARIHKLPMGSRLAGSNVLVTHETMRRIWANLPTAENWYDDQRFRAALEFIMENTYTHSLWKDVYPISVNTNTFKAGTIVLYLNGAMGHTRIVSRADRTIEVLASDLPRIVRSLNVGSFYDRRWPSESTGSEYGYFKIRWLTRSANGWQLLGKENHSQYSSEQFSAEFRQLGSSSGEALRVRLNLQTVSPLNELRSLVLDIRDWGLQRPQIVKDGFSYCQSNECQPGSVGYEIHSTPSRDLKFKENVARANELRKKLWYKISAWKTIGNFKKLLKAKITYKDQATVKLGDFSATLMGPACPSSSFSDPRQSIESRWCVQ